MKKKLLPLFLGLALAMGSTAAIAGGPGHPGHYGPMHNMHGVLTPAEMDKVAAIDAKAFVKESEMRAYEHAGDAKNAAAAAEAVAKLRGEKRAIHKAASERARQERAERRARKEVAAKDAKEAKAGEGAK